MTELKISLVTILPTLLLFLASVRYLTLNQNYRIAIAALYLSLLTGFGALALNGIELNTDSFLFKIYDLQPFYQFDALSSIIYSMIALIGLVVVRYSRHYLDGEKRHKRFISDLSITIAFVQMLSVSGNLITLFIAWTGTSYGLHRLILFYSDRKKARLAARKKFIVARLGDVSLLLAFVFIYLQLGTSNLQVILDQIKIYSISELPFKLELAGLLIVIAACLKSVQVPFHGWLPDVIEAPTPVSALLHAGLLNAGPFLILRFSGLIDLSSYSSVILITVGSISAVFGAISSSLQPSVKSSLAYSSIGHMGFTLFISGLGIYSASLLHLVSHSFYKAHAFLSSGSLIEKIRSGVAAPIERINKSNHILPALFLSGLMFLTFTFTWQGTLYLSFQMLVLSAIIFLGILSLNLKTFAYSPDKRSVLHLTFTSAIVINCFYLFEHLFEHYLGTVVPAIKDPQNGLKIYIIGILLLFAAIVFAQSVLIKTKNRSFISQWEVHFRNGLYMNQWFNRFMNSLYTKRLN